MAIETIIVINWWKFAEQEICLRFKILKFTDWGILHLVNEQIQICKTK